MPSTPDDSGEAANYIGPWTPYSTHRPRRRRSLPSPPSPALAVRVCARRWRPSACPTGSSRCGSASCGAGCTCAASPTSPRCPTSPRSCAPPWRTPIAWTGREIVAEQVSADGTRKWLLRLPIRGHEKRAPEIETVYIPEEDRGTLCISSQVGCTLTCSFCHTGTQRLVRNLEPEEIVGQVLLARDRLGDWPGAASPQDGGLVPTGERKITNVVLMGMGEPLYNFDNVRDAMADGRRRRRPRPLAAAHHALHQRAWCRRSPRWGEEAGTMLAISLHATRDELRDKLVPINRKYPIAELMAACRAYPGPLQRAPHHLRVRDAEGRQRQPRRRQGAGAAARGHPGQDQPDPVQSVARQRLRVLRLGADRALRRGREPGRLRERRSARRAGATSWRPAGSSSRRA